MAISSTFSSSRAARHAAGEAMNAWTEQRLAEIARLAGKARIRRMWIAEDDAWLGGWLARRGFRRTKPDVHMVCPLDAALPAPVVPQGCSVRSSAGPAEVTIRAAAQYGAFGSSAPMDRYVERFTRFMRSPVTTAVGRNRRLRWADRAFCIAWPDLLNKVGLFRRWARIPTSSVAAEQGRDAQSAAPLQAAGMQQAIVSTPADNLPAVRLYEAVGFRVVSQLWMMEKAL
jgi:hypothetical protein